MGLHSDLKNQLEFQDFHEVYPISKTLMHPHEVQNVGRFILGYHINRKYSHFNKRLEKLVKAILSKIQENFCKGLNFGIRIQVCSYIQV
jgi:hypothetical protein